MELYRRHSPACKHQEKGAAYTKCSCPIWVDARPKFRKSLKTRNWEQAIRRLDKLAEGSPASARTVASAVALFVADCRARHLADSTVARYERILNPFLASFDAAAPVAEITMEHLTHYRKNRKVTPLTQSKELECLKSFCWFCVNHGWLPQNPALRVRAPIVEDRPTLPYEKEEVRALMAACEQMENWYAESAARARIRARALVLLLLYSGLRVSDAVKLERWRLKPDGRLLLRQMKTGHPLYVKLPPECLESLAALPKESEYFFWSGTAKLSTAVGSARRTIECLGRMTKIAAHPHRFRDTFAVRLLLEGVDIRTVSLLLGHKSVKTTEKHYAPWVLEFQRMLDSAVERLKYD